MEKHRYHSLIITLHWIMALSFILMLISGLSMEYLELERSFKFKLYQWHKSLGIILMLAVILRVVVRFIFKAPKMPASLSTVEIRLAKLGHLGLYMLMIIVPLIGWAMVSTSAWGLPTVIFGWFEFPHINFEVLMQDTKPFKVQDALRNLHEFFESAHKYLAWCFGGLIVAHIAAVIKHLVWDKENILKRMWWSK